MRGWFSAPRIAAAVALASVGGCEGAKEGSRAADANGANEAVLTGEDQLSGDPELLNEAAADEAADVQDFGGNAAAGEAGNAL